MLSRTADHLFWMARLIERAENLARLLDVTWRLSLVQPPEAANRDWQALISLNSLQEAYFARHDAVSADTVLHFLVSDADNPSSLFACLRAARENAHAVRGSITTEMWETLNSTWLDLRAQSHEQRMHNGPAEFFDWVKMRSSLFRGAIFGTLLQDECYHFIRLGTQLERADNTARILDAKFHVMKPRSSEDAVTDLYQWGALLRSVSAFEVYRKVYRAATITPERVAELLVLHPSMPRSLLFCMRDVLKKLELLANSHSGETQRLAGKLYSELCYARSEEILATGLHDFLGHFMDRIYLIGDGIAQDFLVPSAIAT